MRIGDTLDLAAVQAPRSSGLRTPAFVSVEQLRLLDVAAGSAWPDDLLRAAQVRVILRVLGGCGLRVAELAAARLQDVVPARPVVADRAVLAGRRVEGWQLHVIDGQGRLGPHCEDDP